jgi:hypothetical protein
MSGIITDEPPKTQGIPEEIVKQFSPEIMAAIEAMKRMARVRRSTGQDELVHQPEPATTCIEMP